MYLLKRIRSVAQFYYTQRVKGFPPPQAPMMDEPSVQRLRRELSVCRFYLEFGSGGSTVEADKLDLEGISVENDRYYHRAVREALRENTRIELCTVNIGITKGGGRLLFSNPTAKRTMRWSHYVEAPFPLIAQRGIFPGFVLVDGRFRVACVLATAHHAQQHGTECVIMLDDYEARPHYHHLEEWLGSPERAGRSAFFKISAETKVISKALVEQHYSDWR